MRRHLDPVCCFGRCQLERIVLIEIALASVSLLLLERLRPRKLCAGRTPGRSITQALARRFGGGILLAALFLALLWERVLPVMYWNAEMNPPGSTPTLGMIYSFTEN